MFSKTRGLMAILLVGGLTFLLFSQNAQAALYDHFVDESVSDALWTVIDNHGISIYDTSGTGSIDISTSVLDREYTAMTTSYFTGNFDVRLKYENWSLYADNPIDENADMAELGLIAMTLNAYNNWNPGGQDPLDYIYMARGRSGLSGACEYFSYGQFGGSEGNEVAIKTTSTTGFMKIVRENDDFSTYYSSDGSSWTDLYSVNDKFTDPVVIGARVFSGDTSLTSFGVDMDYVDISSDGMQPIPEPGTMMLLGSLATGLFGMAGLKRRFNRN